MSRLSITGSDWRSARSFRLKTMRKSFACASKCSKTLRYSGKRIKRKNGSAKSKRTINAGVLMR